MNYKRINILCGHYGSGKTNLAVNMAFDLKKRKDRVAVLDMDIVNPYFRTTDSEEELTDAGIRLIRSEYANTNLDAPALPQAMYSVIDDKELYSVIDVGGDDRGALALGRLSGAIRDEDSYEMFMVINMYRPLTRTPQDTVQIMREIEAACRLPFTSIINNSNLGIQTDADTVLASVDYADEVSRLSALPVAAIAVDEKIYNQLDGKLSDLFPVELQKRPV